MKLLLPALGTSVDPRELEPGRRLEFALAEQVWSGLLMLVLLVLMVGALGVWGRWRHAAGAASAPILLIPRGRQAAMVFAAGVAAPVLAYFLYARIPILGGREFGLSYLPHRFAAEFLLLGLSVGALTGWFASRFVRRRCTQIGVESPPAKPWGGRVLAGLLVLGWVLCPMTRGVTREFPSWGSTALAVAGLAAAAALVLVIIRGFGMLRADPRYGLYLGTWGRTLAPVYATSILLLALLTQPYLRHQEHAWIQRDTLLALDDQAGFTGLESRVTQRLMDDFHQAWTQPANDP